MVPEAIKNRKTPEGIIQDEIVKYLKARDWFVKETHGNMYQSGFPDLYANHLSYGHRWIEIKQPTGYSFTGAQMRDFPKFNASGDGIWILTAANECEYGKLFEPQNWILYLLLLNTRTACHMNATSILGQGDTA